MIICTSAQCQTSAGCICSPPWSQAVRRHGAVPTPDPAVMRDYIDKLTRFFIDNTEWVRLSEEARGYIGALNPKTDDSTTKPTQD